MKKLNRLQINAEKLIKDDELATIKGGEWMRILCNGYGSGCVLDSLWCGNAEEDLRACNIACPGTTIAICFAF